MRLQESGEMYLETLLILSQKQSRVRSVDVGEYMGYSKPSVSRAIGLLRQGGYVLMDESGFLTLTEIGREVAERTLDRHRTLSECFIRLGVPPDIASEDACKIEHDISDETFRALREHMGL